MDRKQLLEIASAVSKTSSISRTAGKVEFVKDTGPIRRDLRVKDFEYSPDCLRTLAKILWATQRAQSYSMSALRLFSKMPSIEFSPDGLLGGSGYIQSIKDMRASFAAATEALSGITDTIHDEISGSHWNTAEETTSPEVQPVLDDANQIKTNPDSFVEDEFESVSNEDFDGESDDPEEDTIENPSADGLNPEVEDDDSDDDEETNPFGAGFDQQASTLDRAIKNVLSGRFSGAVNKALRYQESRLASRDDTIGERGVPKEEEWASDDPAGQGMGSGTNETTDLYDYDGLDSYASIAMEVMSYSLLPGMNNDKIMPIYDKNLSDEEIAYMIANSKPELIGAKPSSKKSR